MSPAAPILCLRRLSGAALLTLGRLMPSSPSAGESAFKTPDYRNGSESLAQYGSWLLLSCITTRCLQPTGNREAVWTLRFWSGAEGLGGARMVGRTHT